MIVYCITNKVNGKQYIGITVRTLQNRWTRHLSAAKTGSQQHISRAIRKYGGHNFVIVQIDVAQTISQMKELEVRYIAEYDTYNNGYNSTLGGDGTWGRVHNDDTRAKIKLGVKLARDRIYTDEWLTKVRIARQKQIGVSLSDAHRQNISNALKGRIKSPTAGKRSVKVDQFSKDGTFMRSFGSYGDAATAVQGETSDVMRCCQGKRKTVKGYIFRFAEVKNNANS